MNLKRQVSIYALLILIFTAGYCWSRDDSNQATKTYQIIKTEDISIKALTKPLSKYSLPQINALPMNIRKVYRIVVPSNISKKELKLSMKHLVNQVITKNPDIDEISVYAYDREDDISRAYPLGRMDWCPNGDWAGVTPYIASSNDRSSYEYIFDINSKVGQLAADGIPTKQEFAIYDTYKNALWADTDLDEKIITKKIAKKFGISEKKLKEIRDKVATYKMIQLLSKEPARHK